MTYRNRVSVRRSVTALLIATLSGSCTEPRLVDQVVGNYVLTAVNGRTIPAEDSYGDTLVAGRLTIHRNGEYGLYFSGYQAAGYGRAGYAISDSGSWSLPGNQLTLTPVRGLPSVATYANGAFEFSAHNSVWRVHNQLTARWFRN